MTAFAGYGVHPSAVTSQQPNGGKGNVLDFPHKPEITQLLWVTVSVGNHTVQALFGTGATRNFISSTAVDKLQLHRQHLLKPVNVSTAANQRISCTHFAEVALSIQILHMDLLLTTVQMQHKIILGMRFFVRLTRLNGHHHSMRVGTHKAFALYGLSDTQSLLTTHARETQITDAHERPRPFHTPARNASHTHALATVSPFFYPVLAHSAKQRPLPPRVRTLRKRAQTPLPGTGYRRYKLYSS